MTTATIYVEHLPLMGSIHDRATVVGNFGRKLHLTPEVKPVPGVDELTADIARSLRSEGVESKVAQRLLEILEHHDEWAEEDEPPLDSSTILRARDILEFFEPIEQSQSIAIFPSEQGGITLRSIHDGISIAVDVNPDGISALTVRNLVDTVTIQTIESEASAAAYLAQPA